MQKRPLNLGECVTKNRQKSKLRVLFIQQEWHSWSEARHLSYTIHAFAFEKGFKANGIDCFVLTTPWVPRAGKLLEGMQFDQIWINDIVHLEIDEKCLQYILNLAPIRVGFVIESLEYLPEEYANIPELENRKSKILNRIKKYTHVLMADEKDVLEINTLTNISAMWCPSPIPRSFIGQMTINKPESKAIFSGAIYGSRGKFLEDQKLKTLLVYQTALENSTIYPFLFNSLNNLAYGFIKSRLPGDKKILPIYLKLLKYIRLNCFVLWLKGMQSGCAVVNLPSFFKGYAGRVIEGIAAGCPIISWRIPDRLQTVALFKDNEDILLYDKDDPEDLVRQIRRIQTETGLASRLIVNSKEKIMRNHTMERRVEQIIQWIETGDIPNYE